MVNLPLAALIPTVFFSIFLLLRLMKMKRRLNDSVVRRGELFKRSPEFLVIIDRNMIVKEVSRSVLSKFRMNRAGFLGLPLNRTPIWPDTVEGQNRTVTALRKAMEGYPSVFSLEYPREGFGTIDLEIRVFPVPADGGSNREAFCVARDVTRDVENRKKLLRRQEVEDLIAGISAAALEVSDIRVCVPAILRSAGDFLGARGAFLFQTDEEGNILWEALWGVPGAPNLPVGWRETTLSAMITMVAADQEPGYRHVTDLQENPSLSDAVRGAARKAGAGSLMFTPLKGSSGTVFGYAGFTFNTREIPRDESSPIILRLLNATLSGLLQKSGVLRDLELFRQSADASGQGIALIDSRGYLAYANQAYSTLTGLTEKSGEPVWSVYSGSCSDKVKKLIIPLVSAGERWSGELKIRVPDGPGIDTIESFYPIDTQTNSPRFIVNIITDISDRIRLESQLIAAKKEAELANRAKSDYLANMSHEIRTPMNAVIGLTFLALQTGLDDRQRDYLNKINAAARNLLAIINDILDLSKIESGRLELEEAPYSLDEMLENLAAMTVDRAREKGLKVLFERSPDILNNRVGDRYRLGQILLNLVGNAVKFTDKGYVMLRVESAGPGSLRFTVEDTGIGMTEEQISRLFKPFSQAEASTTRIYGGTGLGLTISRQITEMMGGTIRVESESGKGSRFFVTVPAGTAGTAGTTGETASGKPAEQKGLAFVVCNDAVIGAYHTRALVASGYRPITCRSIMEALERSEKPTLLLLDADACCKDPLKAAHILSEGMDKNFLLVLSGNRSAAELEGLMPAGVRGVILPLPYSLSGMEAALRRAYSGENPENTEKEAAIPGKTGGMAVRGRVLVVDDNQVNLQVGRELIQRTGLIVDVAGSGREALASCRKSRYDLVFLDLYMPEMSGYEAAAEIRRNHPGLPIIAMTASTLSEVTDSIREAGFTRYITKPIDPDELYRMLSDVLDVPVHAPGSVEYNSNDVGTERLEVVGLDVETGLRHVLGDREAFKKMLFTFLVEFRDASGRLRAAVLPDNMSETISLLHSLRGSAGHIGAENIRTESGRLEENLRKGRSPDKEDLEAFCDKLDSTLNSISGLETRGNRNTLLKTLENMIRNSDRAALPFLMGNFEDFSDRRDESHFTTLRKALHRLDYDAALYTIEDWRNS